MAMESVSISLRDRFSELLHIFRDELEQSSRENLNELQQKQLLSPFLYDNHWDKKQ